MRLTKHYNDLLQVLTEDENLRIRKGDMVDLMRANVLDVMQHIILFEERIEEKLQRLKEQQAHMNK